MTSLIRIIMRYIDDFDSHFPIFHMPGFQNEHLFSLIADNLRRIRIETAANQTADEGNGLP